MVFNQSRCGLKYEKYYVFEGGFIMPSLCKNFFFRNIFLLFLPERQLHLAAATCRLMKFITNVIFILFIAVFATPFDAHSDPLLKGKIKVDGLSCPFCAYGMEKKLKAVSWIKEIEIFVDDGYAQFIVTDGKKLNTKALDKAIKNGGFTPKEIELTVEGIIEKSGTEVMFKVKPDILLYLDPNAARDRLLKNLDDTNRTLKITGKAVTKKARTHINIEKYEVL